MNPRLACFLFVAVAFPDLPPAARALVTRMGIPAAAFAEYVRQVGVRTSEREQTGENDHLIFYVLQSRQFTGSEPIEPAVSAKEFVEGKAIPAKVRARFRQFLHAPVKSERMAYLRNMLPAADSSAYLSSQYERVMRALYGKEFQNTPGFYLARGHSTDTQVPANYAVWSALSVTRAMDPAFHPTRVLVVGPGLDFAPRTGLDERYPPQSYQPYAVADALISLGLAAQPQIHCVDINSRVIRFFEDFANRRTPELHLFTPPGDADYRQYFESLGKAIGATRSAASWQKSIRLRSDVVRSVTAEPLNIVTERQARSYDLVIATNVLIYFERVELLLAIANIEAMLAPGGICIHNDLRPEIDAYAQAAGLKAVQARTLHIASGTKAPLYDAFAIYRRE